MKATIILGGGWSIETEVGPDFVITPDDTVTIETETDPNMIFTLVGNVGPQGAKGDKGDNGDDGNGIETVSFSQANELEFGFTDGSTYTTPSLKGEKGDKGDKGDKGETAVIPEMSEADIDNIIFGGL